jgi:hypothetical protein
MVIRHNICKYPSTGKCIYCGSSQNGLSDEHIIPEALGGRLVYCGASCDVCRHDIEAFEGRLANGLFGSARSILSIKSTKTPRTRTKLKVGKIADPETVKMTYTSRDNHPGDLIMEKLQPPRFLGVETRSNSGKRSIQLVVKNIGGYPRPGNKSIELFCPSGTYLDFTRLLAKIAHCYWIAENPNADLHPVLADFIRCRSESEHDYFVGANPLMVTQYDDLHHVECGVVENEGFDYGYVDIALFAKYPPFNGYRVYVGSVGREMKFVWGRNDEVPEPPELDVE